MRDFLRALDGYAEEYRRYARNQDNDSDWDSDDNPADPPPRVMPALHPAKDSHGLPFVDTHTSKYIWIALDEGCNRCCHSHTWGETT